MFTLGITGGIGSGKSTVAMMFAQLGVSNIDADAVAREIVEPGSPCLNTIVKRFGESILFADGTLDRRQLRSIIFSNPQDKDWLENLTHPLIRDRIHKQLSALNGPYRIFVSPLLYEKKQNWVDRVLVVDVPEAVQIARGTSRDGASEASVRAIIQSQISREERCRLADDIVDNSLSLEHTQQQVHDLHELYIKL